MATRSWRYNKRKRGGSTHDHVLFVVVILVAAAVYSHRATRIIHQQSTLDAVRIAGVAAIFLVCIRLLSKLRINNNGQHVGYSLVATMSGVEFEEYIAGLLPKQGYRHVRLTERYDFGFDIIAEKDNVKWGIQIKRHNRPIKMDAVRQAVAALKHYNCDQAMVITNSSFTSSARKLAASNKCLLIDGEQLEHWAVT